MLKAVLDTNVFLRALINPFADKDLLDLKEYRRVKIVSAANFLKEL
ncbi:MAG: hypothetical protein WC632_01140 [Candidatus Margulisiibacteriota bacterium]